MKFTAKRLLAAGAIGVSAIVTPIALTVALPGVAGLTTVADAQPAGPDTITFNQPASTPDTYVFTSPANQTQTTQQVTPSGKCGTPSVSGGSPILSLTGKLYGSTGNSNYYLNSSSPDPASITAGATGACNISPPQSLENKSGKGAEALDFSVVGANTSIIGANRLITDAQIWVQRKDSGVALNPSVNVVLVEFDSSGNQVGTQSCLINGNQGTNVLADTATSANNPQSDCTGTPAPQIGFATVEVQDWTTSTSISVVTPPVAGPSATFTLANSVCGGQTISSTPGPNGLNIPATLTMTGTGQCKTYATFSAQPNGSLNFAGFSGGSAVTFNVTITWPKEPLCQPYGDENHPDQNSTPIPPASGPGETLPTCAPHEFSVDGQNFYDQTYCQTALPPNQAAVVEQEMCTVQKTYTNDTVTVAQNGNTSTTPLTMTMPDGTVVPATQITETWVGDIDMYWK